MEILVINNLKYRKITLKELNLQNKKLDQEDQKHLHQHQKETKEMLFAKLKLKTMLLLSVHLMINSSNGKLNQKLKEILILIIGKSQTLLSMESRWDLQNITQVKQKSGLKICQNM